MVILFVPLLDAITIPRIVILFVPLLDAIYFTGACGVWTVVPLNLQFHVTNTNSSSGWPNASRASTPGAMPSSTPSLLPRICLLLLKLHTKRQTRH